MKLQHTFSRIKLTLTLDDDVSKILMKWNFFGKIKGDLTT